MRFTNPIVKFTAVPSGIASHLIRETVMLEILLIWQFCKKIGDMMRQKGRPAIWFQLMFAGAWFGGEILGAIFGAIVTGGGLGMYLIALGCAIAGATAAYVIAKNAAPAPSLRNDPTGGFPVIQSAPASSRPPQT